jgi:hypothetical protein
MRAKAKRVNGSTKGRPPQSPQTVQKYTLGVRLSEIEYMLLSALRDKIKAKDPLSPPVTMSGLLKGAAIREARSQGFDVVVGDGGELVLREPKAG